MLPQPRSVFALGLAVSVVLVSPRPGDAQRGRLAQPTPPPAAVSSQEQAYMDAINAGLEEYGQGRFGEARAFFLQAHATLPSARTLRGIGMCAFELGDYVGAISLLTDALASEVRPLDAAQRTHVEALLSRSLLYVGRLTLTLTPATATVQIDGAAPVMREGVALLNPGDHEITVEAPGVSSAVRRVHVESAAAITVTIDLTPPPAPVAQPAPRRRRNLTLPLTGFGVAGAGVITLAIAGPMANAKEESLASGCGATRTCTSSQTRGADRLALIADVGIGLTVAGAVAGTVLLFVGPGALPDEDAPAVTVLPMFDRATAGVMTMGSF